MKTWTPVGPSGWRWRVQTGPAGFQERRPALAWIPAGSRPASRLPASQCLYHIKPSSGRATADKRLSWNPITALTHPVLEVENNPWQHQLASSDEYSRDPLRWLALQRQPR